MRCLIILSILITFSFTKSSAQEIVVSGSVHDKNNRPVPNSSVALLTTADSVIRHFTRTDQLGNFALKGESQSPLVLSVSKHGFLTEYRSVDFGTHTFSFSLQQDTVFRIEEVVVNRKRKLHVSGDTTSYNLDSFRIGNEDVLEQALARLPGFEVREDGRISVNGRPVQKILVDGDDLVSSQYTLLSQNLSSDLIEDVQVIDNYLDDPFYRTPVRTDDLALNLKFKESFTSTLLTNIALEGGTVNRYNANINNILLTNSTKLYALTTANNIGRDITANRVELAPRSALVSSYRPDAASQTLVNVGLGQVPQVEKQRWFDNNSNLFSINLIQPLSPKTNTRLNSGLGYTRSRQQKSSHANYFLTEGQDITFSEEHGWHGNALVFTNNLQLDHLLSSRQRIRYEMEADLLREDEHNRIHFNADPLHQQLRSRGSKITNSLNYVNRFQNSSFLSLDLYHRSARTPQDYWVRGYDYAAILQGHDIADIQQRSNIPHHFYGGRATYYFTLIGMQLVGRSGHEKMREDLSSTLAPTPAQPHGPTLRNDLRYTTDRSYIELEVDRQISRTLTFRGLIAVDNHHLSRQAADSDNAIHKVIVRPDLRLVYTPASRSRLTLSYRETVRQPTSASLYDNIILSGYRNASTYTDSLFLRPTKNYSLGYRFNDSYSQFSFNTNIFYSLTGNSFIPQNTVTEALNLSHKVLGVDNENLGIMYGTSKFFPALLTTLKLSGSAMNLKIQNEINSTGRRQVDNWIWDNNAAVISSYAGIFNYILSVRHNSNKNRIPMGDITQKVMSSFTKVQLTSDLRFKGGLFFQADLSRYQWVNNGHSQKPFVLLDANFRKSVLNNKATLTVSMRNLLGSELLQFNQTTDYFSHATTYNLLGRMLLIGLRFNI